MRGVQRITITQHFHYHHTTDDAIVSRAKEGTGRQARNGALNVHPLSSPGTIRQIGSTRPETSISTGCGGIIIIGHMSITLGHPTDNDSTCRFGGGRFLSDSTCPDDGRSRGYLGDDFDDLDDLDLDDDDHDPRLQGLLTTPASIFLSRPLHASRRKASPPRPASLITDRFLAPITN